jgi:hypothetical protein
LAQSWVDWGRQNPLGPSSRIEDSLVYDSVTGRLIMFGGYDHNWNRMHDIWEYDGGTRTWVDVTPPSGALPAARWGQSMAFDPNRRKVILFGGQDDNLVYLSDTWEWDTVAKTWTNVTPATSPTARRGTQLVYEAATDRMILVGGVDDNRFYNDTWAWSPGSRTWTKLNPSVSSAAGRTFIGRGYPGAAYNSSTGRVTLFGGVGFPTGSSVVSDQNDTWELRGNVWTDVTPGGSPPGRGWTQLAYDAVNGRIVMFGGFRVAQPNLSYGDTWAFQNGAWAQIVPESGGLGVRDSHGMVYDAARQRIVVFGGYLADVLELTGNSWSRVLETVWPPVQDAHSMAYDSDRDVVFMYGGGSYEAWELTVPTKAWNWYFVGGPGGRTGSSVVYQPNRRRMLLLGGRARTNGTVGASLGDTWEWDTAAHSWTNVSPGSSPTARDEHAMAFDVGRSTAVLFGGRDANGSPLGDTWVWNGSSWSNVTASGGPSARFGHSMTYDVARGVIVLFGGDNGSQKLNDVWEWDGANRRWNQAFPGTSPPARAYAAMSSFDAGSPGVAVFGGVGSSLLNDTWIWNGSSWSQATAGAGAPTARQGAEMVYATASQRMVSFGGRDSRGLTNELWFGSVSAASAWPAPVSVTPSQGGGAAATFTAIFRHASGASQMKEVQFLISNGPGVGNAVYLLYSPSTNTLQLRNDNDSGWSSGPVGSGGTLSNGQVSVSLASSGASVSGTDIRLTLPLTFATAFNGPKSIYMSAIAQNGSNPNGWMQKGSFFVSSGNSTPQMVSVTPVTGSGWSQTFTATYREPNGLGDLQQAYFLINTSISGYRGVYVYYVPAANMLYLRDDNDSSWGAGKPVGSSGYLGNSQVSIDVVRATVTRTATDLTLTLPLTFTASFAGQKNVYLMGVDFSGARPPLDVLLGRFGVGTSTPGVPPIANDLRVYHPANGTWYSLTAASGFTNSSSQQWGLPGDKPLRADFDGDGQSDLVVYRPSDGTWWIKFSATNFATMTSYQWGLRGDIPVVADFDGDHKADLVVYRPTEGSWWFKHSSSNYTSWGSYQWGAAGDLPVRGDFDGDGKSDLVVFRPSTGVWYMRLSYNGYSLAGTTTRTWGVPGDVPIPEDFDGDGRSDLVVYRPTDGTWSVWFSSGNFASGNWAVSQWGLRGDEPVLGDYDGDGKAELAVFRPTTGTWFFKYSTMGYNMTNWRTFQFGQAGDMQARDTLSWTNRDVAVYRPSSGMWTIGNGLTSLASFSSQQWGLAGDLPQRADFDGDGQQDLVVYRPSNGTWWISYSSTGFATQTSYQWGLPGDMPVPADYDGDGRADIGIFRPASGEWLIRYSSQGYSSGAGSWFQWGLAGDVAKPGDFDGDGKADLVVYRPASGEWFIRNSSYGYQVGAGAWYFQWGLAGDTAVPEDVDGDGKADLVVYRSSNGTWWVRYSTAGWDVSSCAVYQWGLSGDTPVAGDFDGDGHADLTVWRPSTGTWYFLSSVSGNSAYRVYQSGQNGDVPLAVK